MQHTGYDYSEGNAPYLSQQGHASYQPQTYGQENKSFPQQNTQGTTNYYPQSQQSAPNNYHPQSASPAPVQGGIAALQQFEQVTVKQGIEYAEAILGFETANKYSVLGPQGQLLLCGEKSNVMMRYMLGKARPLDFEIVDNNNQTVMRINRPFKLWKKNITVEDAQGGNMGTIRKKLAITSKKFILENASGQVLYTLEGNPIYPKKFKILDNSDKEVGQILKKWGGLAQEMLTDADTFTCFFPPGADITSRALLVAATLFIDLTHFEN